MIILTTQFLVLISLLVVLLIGVAVFVGIASTRKSEQPWYRNSIMRLALIFLCIVAIGIIILAISVLFFATAAHYGPPHTIQSP